MNDQEMTRPVVMESIMESELQELELRVSDGNKAEFEELARGYGWDDNSVSEAWRWFEIQAGHPSDPTT